MLIIHSEIVFYSSLRLNRIPAMQVIFEQDHNAANYIMHLLLTELHVSATAS